MLLAANRKAKRKHHTVSIAFCDIAKAYDSVNRELLYVKLDSVCFGGRVKNWSSLCIITTPLWFTKGVKQGCEVSPLLFAISLALEKPFIA